jgi:hypothetical protein
MGCASKARTISVCLPVFLFLGGTMGEITTSKEKWTKQKLDNPRELKSTFMNLQLSPE